MCVCVCYGGLVSLICVFVVFSRVVLYCMQYVIFIVVVFNLFMIEFHVRVALVQFLDLLFIYG